MKDHVPGRRKFLKIMILLPMAFVIEVNPLLYNAVAYAATLSPRESLRKLVLLIGPWSAGEKKVAEDFGRRFIASEHAVGQYLPESSKLVQSLASRFSAETLGAEEIDLRKLPTEEQELLMKLVKQLYSFVEVRFQVNKEPEWGECQTDTARHTRPPA
jgi:hypothetical protein